jgi:quercetin dioxygenase-like cupin family protein
VERWHIPSIEAAGRREPRVLLSQPECRAVVIDLRDGERLGDHSVHERALLQVVSGKVDISAGGEDVVCDAGTLVTFAPGERHSVVASGAARLLLMLAPWPGEGHYPDGTLVDSVRTPANATERPMS